MEGISTRNTFDGILLLLEVLILEILLIEKLESEILELEMLMLKLEQVVLDLLRFIGLIIFIA